MVHVRLSLFVILLFSATCVNGQNDSLRSIVFAGSANMEVRFGPNCMGNEQATLSCPHIIIGGRLSLLNGWSVTSQFEYEHSYDNHEWGNDFNSEFCTNMLYVTKNFSDALNVKVGILDIPVGKTNSGGPALTIDDPDNEADIMPMMWHETGISLFGSYKKFAYSLTATSYLNTFEMLGVAARTDYRFGDSLRVGLSGYIGKKCHGMIGREMSDKYSSSCMKYFTMDMDYSVNGFMLDCSMVYCSGGNCKSIGCEFGYDLMSHTDYNKFHSQIIPFLRYDCVCGQNLTNKQKYTMGIDVVPIPNLIFKAEYGIRDYAHSVISSQLAFSLGYTVNF